jgi:hypothetical protein
LKNDPNARLGATETTSDDDVYCDECNGLNGFHMKNCSLWEDEYE